MNNLRTNKIAFTSKINLITIDGISKIKGEKVNLEILKGNLPNCHSFLCVKTNAEGGIMSKHIYKQSPGQRFEPRKILNLHVGTENQLNKLMEVFNKAQNPNSKNFHVTYDERLRALDIVEY